MDQRFTRMGTAQADLEEASKDRLMDAEILLKGKRTGAAIAQALYALEMALKVQICRRLDLPSLPKAFEIHDLVSLLFLSSLSRKIEENRHRKAKISWDEILQAVEQQTDFRYLPSANWTKQDAQAILAHAKEVILWLSKSK